MLPRDAVDALLHPVLLATAAVLLVGTSAALAAALASELLRRWRRAPRVAALLERLAPWPLHRLAVVCVATSATVLAGISPARADSSVRDWLARGDATTTTTTTTVAPGVATEDGLDRRSAVSRADPAHRGSAAAAAPLPSRDAAPDPGAAAPSVGAARGPEAGTREPAVPETAPAVTATTYAVVPGDCLWSIAARALGPGASNAAIDAGWRQIYSANRAVVGDDPGLIHPGLSLTLPPLGTGP